MAISDDWAFIGAFVEPLGIWTIHIYHRRGTQWNLFGMLPPPPEGQAWGRVILDGNLAVASTRFIGNGWECSGGISLNTFALERGEWIFKESLPSQGMFNQCSDFDVHGNSIAVIECHEWYCESIMLHVLEEDGKGEWIQKTMLAPPSSSSISIRNDTILVSGYDEFGAAGFLFEKESNDWSAPEPLYADGLFYSSRFEGAKLCPGGRALLTGLDESGCLQAQMFERNLRGQWRETEELDYPNCVPLDPYDLVLGCNDDFTVMALPDWSGVNSPTFGHAYSFPMPRRGFQQPR